MLKRKHTFIGILTQGLLIIGSVGCGLPMASWSTDGASRAVRTVAAADGVTMTVEVMPREARLSDELRLTLTVDHPREIVIELPDIGDHIGDFRIRSFRDDAQSPQLPAAARDPAAAAEDTPELTQDQQDGGSPSRHQREYRLEPTRAGRLEIEPLAVSYRSADAVEAVLDKLLVTEPLFIPIQSPFAGAEPSLDELAELTGPVDLSKEERRWNRSGLLLVAALVSVLAAIAMLLWVSRKRKQVVPQPSPREIALLELDRLWRTELHRRDVKQYYVRLTWIVRQFFEQTTGLRAPERTTEEFLGEVQLDRQYTPQRRQRLGRFLESADLVKFAAYQPNEADVRTAWELAQDLVTPTEDDVSRDRSENLGAKTSSD